MKIICTKSNLVHAVSIVSKAVSNNTTLPILKCILIEAVAGNIRLTANDMELGIETTVDGHIDAPGKIAKTIIHRISTAYPQKMWITNDKM